MEIFARIAEERIKEALGRGELTDLPGRGKPLVFEDDSLVPEDQRLSMKILRNAGCIPPELELKKEIMALRDLIAVMDEGEGKVAKMRELNYKLMKFNMRMKRPINVEESYSEKVFEKLTSRGNFTPHPRPLPQGERGLSLISPS
ncbi:MAG: DUF1992 domain-containing protein [Deltaproteobacteria bacterium]|nr:DUF1992 domain-containing protein [Deltaproteobacteria bacterium]